MQALGGDRGRCPPACALAAAGRRRRRAPLACRPGMGPWTLDSSPDVKAATIRELAGQAAACTSRGQHPAPARHAVLRRTAPARTAPYAAPAGNDPPPGCPVAAVTGDGLLPDFEPLADTGRGQMGVAVMQPGDGRRGAWPCRAR